MKSDVTCRALVEFLDAYLGGGMDPEQLAAFNAHLAACPSCVAYMKTYQQAGALARAALLEAQQAEPEGVPEELVAAILEARRG